MNLETKVEQAERRAQQTEAKTQKAGAVVQYSFAALDALHARKSWRFIALLRWFFVQAKRLKQEGFQGRVKAFIKKALRKINHELLLRPALRKKLSGASRRLGIHGTLKSLFRKAHGQKTCPAPLGGFHTDAQNGDLSPRARQIYTQLLLTQVIHKNKWTR